MYGVPCQKTGVSGVSDRSGVLGGSEAQAGGGSGLRILDLGCGTGITSLFLAKETGARVFAVDLGCSATDNQKRMEARGVGDQEAFGKGLEQYLNFVGIAVKKKFRLTTSPECGILHSVKGE